MTMWSRMPESVRRVAYPFIWRAKRGGEDRFTPPRVDCPHPGHWTATDYDSTELEVTELVASFVRGLQPDFVVETGTAHGQTAHAIGRALKRNGHGRLVTLEPNPVRVERARWRVRGLPVDVVQLPSLDYTPPHPIDFAWFDSLIELRADEFRRFLPYMHAGTVVGFHDSGPTHPELRPQLDALTDEGLMTALHLVTPRGVTFGQPIGLPPKDAPQH